MRQLNTIQKFNFKLKLYLTYKYPDVTYELLKHTSSFRGMSFRLIHLDF